MILDIILKDHKNWTDEVENGNHSSSSRRSEVMIRAKIINLVTGLLDINANTHQNANKKQHIICPGNLYATYTCDIYYIHVC